jgi:hypothetical protein
MIFEQANVVDRSRVQKAGRSTTFFMLIKTAKTVNVKEKSRIFKDFKKVDRRKEFLLST